MPQEPIELKVMSFNIRYGTASDGENSWPFRREATLEFLRTCGCDLIGMQEVLAFQLAEIKEAAPWYDWVGVAREDGSAEGEFAAILYDTRRVKVIWSSTFWFSDTPDVVGSTSWGNELTRICTCAAFIVEKRSFQMYNLHIDHESAISRLKSVEMLAYRVHTRPLPQSVIVTGDFNEGEQGPAVQRMLFAGFSDSFRVVHPDGPEQTSFNGWQDVTLGDKIDYVFTFGDWTVLDSEIVRDKPFDKFVSDHYPVIASLRLGVAGWDRFPSPEGEAPKLNFPLQDHATYLEMLASVGKIDRGPRFWEQMIMTSHNRFEATVVSPDQVFRAVEAVGKALFKDRGEEHMGGLSNFKALTSISGRLRSLVVAPEFDRSAFGDLALRYVWEHPEAVSNRYLLEVLYPLVKRVGGRDAFNFFRLLYRYGDIRVKTNIIRHVKASSPHRVSKFLTRISSSEKINHPKNAPGSSIAMIKHEGKQYIVIHRPQ